MVFLENNFDGFITLMKNMKYFFLSFLLVSFYGLKAQTFDSNFFKKEYEMYLKTPVFLPLRVFDNFTESSLYVNTERGDLHLGQQEVASTDFGIATGGIYRHNALSFFGSIDINRHYQSDKKWNLSPYDVNPNNGVMPSPHYYAVSKVADWNNQHYRLLGGIVFPIWKDKWYFSLHTNYDLEEKYRIEYDPRPKFNNYYLSFSGATAVKVTPSSTFSVGGKYGYDNQTASFSHQDSHTAIPFHYEKYMRWQLGYGTLQNPTSTSKRYKHSHKGYSLGYHYDKSSLRGLVYVRMNTFVQDLYRSDSEEEDRSDVIASLYADTYEAGAQCTLSTFKGNKWLFYTNVMYHDAYNYLSRQGGKTYATDQTRAIVAGHWFENRQHASPWEIALNLSYDNAYQKDVIATTTTNYTSCRASVYFNKAYTLGKWEVKPFVEVGYKEAIHRLDNQNTILSRTITDNDYASKTLKLFYEEVILHDHILMGKTQYDFQFGAGFKKVLSQALTINFGVSSQYRTTFAGNDRYGVSLNISIYY